MPFYSALRSLHTGDMQAMLIEVITFEQNQTEMKTTLVFYVCFFRRSAHQIFWNLSVQRAPDALRALFWSKKTSHPVQCSTLCSQEAWDRWVSAHNPWSVLGGCHNVKWDWSARVQVMCCLMGWTGAQWSAEVTFYLDWQLERKKNLANLWWFSLLHLIVSIFIWAETNS